VNVSVIVSSAAFFPVTVIVVASQSACDENVNSSDRGGSMSAVPTTPLSDVVVSVCVPPVLPPWR
jgi:hypothetical protein